MHLLTLHLLKNMFYGPLVSKGIDFTTGHIVSQLVQVTYPQMEATR